MYLLDEYFKSFLLDALYSDSFVYDALALRERQHEEKVSVSYTLA